MHFLGKTLLVFSLLHSAFQGQIWLLLQVFLDFLLLHSRLQPGALSVGGCDFGALSEAKGSYPTSEVRGSGHECQCNNGQKELPKSEARHGGREELPHV